MEFFIVLMHRELPAWRSILYPITRVGLPVLIGAILCSFFYDQGYNLTGISNVMGVLFISSLLPIFMAQVFVEVREKLVLLLWWAVRAGLGLSPSPSFSQPCPSW